MNAQLESVLDAYVTSEPGPSRATVTEWIQKYPQFARELVEFTANWQLLEWADEVSPGGPAASELVPNNDRLFLRGMSAAQSALYALRAKRQATQLPEGETLPTPATLASATKGATIPSLLAAAKHVGFSRVELRDRVGLSDALLQKLNRRLIDPQTIPNRVLADLAAVLEQPVETVGAYVAYAPTFAVGAQHRASQAPTLPETREDFFDAVQRDMALSGARKQELLALPHPRATAHRASADGR